MPPPTNTAAYLLTTASPVTIKPAPLSSPLPHEILIKTHAVAINPVDYGQQLHGPSFFPWMTYPYILGYDVSGTISSIGSSVKKFKEGDRVIGLAKEAFQEYVVVEEYLVAKLPDEVSFEKGAVIPLGFSVAVKGLFHEEYLALDRPGKTARTEAKGKAVLVYGGSSSVGSNAVQLAKAAGYEVISTASPANFEYVKTLGTSQVFDHNSPSIKEDLIAAFKGKEVVGAFANGAPRPDGHQAIVEVCAAVLLSSPENRKFVALLMKPRWVIPQGIESKFIEPLRDDKELASAFCNGFLPGALEDGSFVPSPPAQVVGKGLVAIQGAMDLLKGGVSAKKLVVAIRVV